MPERVLVVDDDALVRRMLTRSLAAEGFEVEHVADGGAALAAAESSAPDLVVLDVTMPGLDGLAVCRRLRANGLRGSILMLTARDAVADRVAGLEAGADDYLVKPFAIEELVARLHALGRRGRDDGDRLAYGDLVLELSTRTAQRGGRPVRSPPARATCSSCCCATRGGRPARAGDRGDLARGGGPQRRRPLRGAAAAQAR